jgi:DNA-binding ferritin-like protein
LRIAADKIANICYNNCKEKPGKAQKSLQMGRAEMYKRDKQLKLSDFVFPYGKLNADNDWVKLAELIPWDKVEEKYAAQFVDNGHPAHPVRMALGALIIRQRMKCSDVWTVKHVSENPYLQYLIGMKEYSNSCPFGASTMVEFRKRFGEEELAEILELTIPKPEPPKDDNASGGEASNEGTLIMDATCCPADVAYPQDIKLLNETREKLEETIDEICEASGAEKPRTYRKQARKAYLKLAKSKKRTGKQLHTAIKKQLQYIRRDIGYIVEFVKKGHKLTQRQKDLLNLLTTVYEQQRIMLEEHTHRMPDRIVSLSQPWVRPIVRGKAKAKTEFGAKLHISLTDGYARIERLSFDAFNEAEDFFKAVERYRQRYGRYPARILVDKLYRNRDTLAFCKERGIRMTGPVLGRPTKDEALSREQKQLEYADLCDRNAVEGSFGTGKTAYGLGRIFARRADTSFCVIGIALLCMNLQKRLRSLLRRFGIRCRFFGFFHQRAVA